MRTLGIDLAVQAAHTAVVVDDQGQAVTPLLHFHTTVHELDEVLARARQGTSEPALQAVMEPTGLAWFPVAVYLQRQQIAVYLVNSQEVADLRRYYKRHAKSDRIDARVLASLPRINPDKVHILRLPSATTFACQRGCKQLDRWMVQMTAIQNRLIALDRLVWPTLQPSDLGGAISPAARWFREHCYSPYAVVQHSADTLRQLWENSAQFNGNSEWIDTLVNLAPHVVALYGDGACLDFNLLQQEARQEQALLEVLEELHHTLQIETVRPLYRQIHPSRNLETIKGVGQDGAAVYASFISDPTRFASLREYRGWTGMIPNSKQSALSEAQGLHITQAGPELVKKFAYLDAQVARQYDPQLAALYYDQMVNRGKHYNQAICAVATHVLDRVFAVLRDDQPYELRDVEGRPITEDEAQQLIAERYTVPRNVRQRQNKRRRREKADRRAEKKTKREGCAQ